MIIFWGTKVRQEELGTVADWCRACGRVRAFAVSDRFKVGHVYYISLGRETLVGMVRECYQCGEQFWCTPGAYDTLLSAEEVKGLSLREIVARTNPRLDEGRDPPAGGP